MTTYQMPEGVEHNFLYRRPYWNVWVTTYQMPEGVEHPPKFFMEHGWLIG